MEPLGDHARDEAESEGTMAKQRVISLAFGRDDLEAIKAAISYTLENENKLGQQTKRVKLYSLKRRVGKALLDLER